MRTLLTVLSGLLLVVGCGPQDDPPGPVDQQVGSDPAPGEDDTDDPGGQDGPPADAATSFEGSVEFQLSSGGIVSGVYRLTLEGDGSGRTQVGLFDPESFTATEDELAAVAGALDRVDLAALGAQDLDDPDTDGGDRYRFERDGEVVEADGGASPQELRDLAQVLTTLVEQHDPNI